MHSIFWGALPSHVLQTAAGLPFLEAVVAAALERMIQARLDTDTHFRHVLRDLSGQFVPSPSLYKVHDPISEPEEFKKDTERVIDRVNVHHHMDTCFKGNKMYCRMARPQALNSGTNCVAIEPPPAVPEGEQQIEKFVVLDSIPPPSQDSQSNRNLSMFPTPVRDDRTIIWEIYRPAISKLLFETNVMDLEENENLPADLQAQFDALDSVLKEQVVRCMLNRNGMVIETNAVNAALLGCNTNVGILGSDSQAKAGLCYLLKYITKPPAEILESLSLMYNARRTIRDYPSRAEDSGTDHRTGMHFLNRYLNQTSGLHEISSQMAAVAILGMPAELCSHGFFLVFVNAAIAYAQRKEAENPDHESFDEGLEFADLTESNDFTANRIAEDCEEMEEDFLRQDEIDEDVEPAISGRDDNEHALHGTEAFGTSIVYTTAKGKEAVPQHIHYAFRGPQLFCLSLYEYASLIIVSEKKKSRGSSNNSIAAEPENENTSVPDIGGRQANTTFPFAIGHPLRDTHVQKIRSKSLVPVPVAYPPQPPPGKQPVLTDAWKQQARKFSRYVLTLFRPWAASNGQLPGDLSWHSYTEFMRDLVHGVSNGGQTHLGRIRHAWVTNVAHGLRISSKVRTATQHYRCRASSKLGVPDGTAALPRARQHPGEDEFIEDPSLKEAEETIEQLRDENALDDLLERTEKERQISEYNKATLIALESIMGLHIPENAIAEPLSLEAASNLLSYRENITNFPSNDLLMKALKIDIPVEEMVIEEELPVYREPNPMETDDPQPPMETIDQGLNQEQQSVFDVSATYFRKLAEYKQGTGARPEPFRLLIHVI